MKSIFLSSINFFTMQCCIRNAFLNTHIHTHAHKHAQCACSHVWSYIYERMLYIYTHKQNLTHFSLIAKYVNLSLFHYQEHNSNDGY